LPDEEQRREKREMASLWFAFVAGENWQSTGRRQSIPLVPVDIVVETRIFVTWSTTIILPRWRQLKLAV